MVRKLLPVSVACALLASAAGAAPAPPTAAASVSTYVITGRGWGHGVGMSQYGAYGMARRGATYDKILAHYYRGTTLAKTPVKNIRVLLATGRTGLKLSSNDMWRVIDGDGQQYELAAGAVALTPALKVKVDEALPPVALKPPLSFVAGAEPLVLSRPYRGAIQVTLKNKRLQAVNILGLEAYLQGVVPGEMPHSWPAEALKAQAVAARSYALYHRNPEGSDFDVYDDVRSQVYRGIDEEEPQSNAAVRATAGRVVTYGGKVANTLFFSTSGGRTATSTEVFFGRPVPYLVSVPDPYDSLSPYHSWGPYPFDGDTLAKKLKVPGSLVDLRVTKGASGRVMSVTAVGTAGEVTVTGSDVRRLLDLRSSWFGLGVLSLERPTKPVVYGQKLTLRGVARGVTGVTLEQRVGARSWETVAAPKPAAGGEFTALGKPAQTTEYRLAVGDVRTSPVKAIVAPVVRFDPARPPDTLTGTTKPVLPGAKVQVQRREGTAWRVVATAVAASRGEFEATLALTPGTYRARFAPGRGYAVAFSPILEIVAP